MYAIKGRLKGAWIYWKYVLLYVNWNVRPVETIPGIGKRGRIKKNDRGVNSSMVYFKNICKCHNVLQVKQ
jgi:hypothetical protein